MMITKAFIIQLDGDVTLARFYRALEALNGTLEAISDEVNQRYPSSILIDDLSYGSAIAAVGIDFDQEIIASKFEKCFASVARHVRNNTVQDLPESLQGSGKRLHEAAMMDDGAGFTLSTDTSDFVINPALWTNAPGQAIENLNMDTAKAFGTVTGMLQSPNSRGALKVVVYDELNDKAVRVSLADDQHELVRELWDTNVVVEGMVRRDPASGRPLAVTEVRNISKKNEPGDPFAWRNARGVLSHIHPEKSSEQLIREARNA